MKFRVELVWRNPEEAEEEQIFLTADGRVILQGRAVSAAERDALDLPRTGALVSVDRALIRALKEML